MSTQTPRTLSRILVAVAAVAASKQVSQAGVEPTYFGPTTGREFYIGTTGATALSAFTSTGSGTSQNFGAVALGSSELRVGNTRYTAELTGQSMARFAGSTSQLNSPGTDADRLVYSYHNLGSINGIIDLARQNGLLSGDAFAVTSSNPIFINGATGTSIPVTNAAVTGQFLASSAGAINSPVPGLGGNYQQVAGFKPRPQIAWSDVVSRQAFAQPGTGSVGARPLAAGYGRGEPASTSGKRPTFQSLTPVGDLAGGLDPATTKLRNESLAVVPFTLSANPGTGLATLKERDFEMLQVRGRLPNGANFNYVTRDIGSGTRNQGGNNLDIDPTWAAGERDRINYTSSTLNITAENGEVVNVAPGEEMAPLRTGLATTGSVNANEHRLSAIATFSDKTSGSSALRPVLQQSRMSLGILSSGDTGSSGRLSSSNATPLRVLSLQFEQINGEAGSTSDYVQPTYANVTEGRYQLWSASQAITVAGTLATSAGATGGTILDAALDGTSNTNRTILNDVNDDGTGVGVVRKFLNNITNSVGQGFSSNQLFTPLDGLVLGGFIPVNAMKVTKNFDGDIQTTNPTYNAGLAGDVSAPLTTALNWANPSTQGTTSLSSQTFRIFDVNATGSNGAISMGYNSRTYLVGDMNGDGVRDLADATAFGTALANPGAFLDANPSIAAGITVRVNDASTNAADGTLAGGTATSPGGRLLVTLAPLTDLNGDGNVTVVGTTGDVVRPRTNLFTLDNNGKVVPVTRAATFATAWLQGLGTSNSFTGASVTSPADRVDPITVADVEYFIYGASIDTINADLDENTPGVQTASMLLSGGTSASEVERLRREVGVRTGKLMVNAAATAVNAGIDASSLSTSAKANLKFQIQDVDQSGSRGFANSTTGDKNFLDDAFLLDSQIGKDYTSLSTVNGALSTPVDLPRFALDDSDTVIGQNDMNVMNQALTASAGINDEGRVDHTWKASFIKPGTGAIVVAPSTGTYTVPNNATFTIPSGSFTAGGSADVFTDSVTGRSLSVVNNVAGGLVIAAGSKKLQALTGTGGTTITAGATLTVDVGVDAPTRTLAIDQASVTVNGTLELPAITARPTISKIGVISIGAAGFVDLNNNDLIVTAMSESAVRGLVSSWWNGGRRDGLGLGSDVAGTSGLDELATLGVITNSTGSGSVRYATFDGLASSTSDVLVKYTFIGDTDLSGQVDSTDLQNLIAGLRQGLTGWINGDTNYDGVVDANDLSNLLKVMNLAGSASFGSPLGSFGGQTAGAVPEPAALGLLALAVPMMSRRRRA